MLECWVKGNPKNASSFFVSPSFHSSITLVFHFQPSDFWLLGLLRFERFERLERLDRIKVRLLLLDLAQIQTWSFKKMIFYAMRYALCAMRS
jgi:hypothetical protein